MTTRRRKLGALGERLARARLEGQGYLILEANWRSSSGEIDLVAQKGDQLVFVEVRTRQGRSYGLPEESLSRAKRERLVTLAEEYVQGHAGRYTDWRVDMVAVEFSYQGVLERIEHIENALF